MGIIRSLKPITLRRATCWIAVAGVALGVLVAKSRRDDYLQRAAEHAQIARAHREHAGRVAALSPTFLRAARVTKLTGLPVALHADASIGVAGLYARETTTVLRQCGSDVGGVAEVSPEARKQFEDLVAAPEDEVEDFRSSTIKSAEGLADYHDRMSRKYGRAASRPWLATEPDQPPR
jgi:hypothetical protein